MLIRKDYLFEAYCFLDRSFVITFWRTFHRSLPLVQRNLFCTSSFSFSHIFLWEYDLSHFHLFDLFSLFEGEGLSWFYFETWPEISLAVASNFIDKNSTTVFFKISEFLNVRVVNQEPFLVQQISMMELFCGNSLRLLTVNHFTKSYITDVWQSPKKAHVGGWL